MYYEESSLLTMPDVFKGLGIKVDVNPNDFLKVVETLTRIGLPSGDQTRLIQSCHILHKRGIYAIMHFKELFLLDGKGADFSESDRHRRNTIAAILEEWGLLKIKDKNELDGFFPLKRIKIISHKDKDRWVCEQKYTIGTRK
jgi:hypothetical protein